MIGTETFDPVPDILEDEYYTEHRITKKLGEGGQGFVCQTQNPLIVIKLVTDGSGNPIERLKHKDAFEKYKNRFASLRIAPLPNDIHISLPVALLKDYAGYVMHFMEDMLPLSALDTTEFPESAADYPAWLVGNTPSQDVSAAQKILYAYCKNGGLRRRLDILGKAAQVLAELHAAGLVYCDISYNNIFVTGDIEFETPNVWFIDADNIFTASENCMKGNTVYTPRYGAPEVVLQQSACTQQSDIYAFALTAFEKLTLIYPFAGKAADNWEDGDNWDQSSGAVSSLPPADPMQKAAAGELDWIWAENGSNTSEDGLPQALTLTDRLFTLFDRTFQAGRKNPAARPSAFLWTKALFEAHDLTLQCPDCAMSWYYSGQGTECPYCGHRLGSVMTIEENGSIIFAHEVIPEKPIRIAQERIGLANMQDARRNLLSVVFRNSENALELIFHKIDNYECTIEQKGQREVIYGQLLVLYDDFTVEIENDNKYRAFSVRFLREP